jgi:hypothetical protein
MFRLILPLSRFEPLPSDLKRRLQPLHYQNLFIYAKFTIPNLFIKVASKSLKRKELKGTVSPDFSSLVFFFKQLLLAPVDKPSNDFDFFSNIREDIRLFRCLAGVIDTGEANDFIIVG